MDQWKSNDFSQPLDSSSMSPGSVHHAHDSHPQSRQRLEMEAKDPIAARKVQKADREKLRRDKLNEHFLELGNTLDPDRPKNDKATILTDTIQLLKDLTDEVNRLKTEHAALSEESRELTQEKNELRDEKASLKCDIDNLTQQYQQRLRMMFPWTAIDSPVVMAPSYSYPVPLPVAPAPITMHPALQPFQFFGNQNPGAVPNPCATFIPYPSTTNPQNELTSNQCASTTRVSNKQDSNAKSSDHSRGCHDEKTDDSSEVATELELKTPGSATHQDKSLGKSKGKQPQKQEKSILDGSSSSRYSCSQGFQDSSSNSIGHPEA